MGTELLTYCRHLRLQSLFQCLYTERQRHIVVMGPVQKIKIKSLGPPLALNTTMHRVYTHRHGTTQTVATVRNSGGAQHNSLSANQPLISTMNSSRIAPYLSVLMQQTCHYSRGAHLMGSCPDRIALSIIVGSE